jgi:hypothetical protein
MDDQYVDVYIDSRPHGYTYLRDGSLVQEIKLDRPSTGVRPHAGTCAHTSLQEVFAYARVSDVHWPIAFCNDCLVIVEGREPVALRESSGAVTLGDVIGRKWAKGLAPGGEATNEATARRYHLAEERLRVAAPKPLVKVAARFRRRARSDFVPT